MINWASSDVDRLFDLATKQLDCISSEVREARAVRKSNENIKVARDMPILAATLLQPSAAFGSPPPSLSHG